MNAMIRLARLYHSIDQVKMDRLPYLSAAKTNTNRGVYSKLNDGYAATKLTTGCSSDTLPFCMAQLTAAFQERDVDTPTTRG